MKELTYIPFGAQYYRAPTPGPENWERDLTALRSKGFNTVKLWVQWRWNMPKRDTYDFSDIDRLMELCGGLGLRVILNVICDVAPAWFYRDYPDSLMVAADGRRLYPQTTAYRQIGGAPGPCYHHREGAEIRRRFIEEAAKRYAGHPALLCWDLWNEPELTCGIWREASQENMVCYCAHSVERFILWLRRRYGSLEVLNRRWGRNYQAWEEIEPPRCAATFNDMVDWREFFGETLAEELHMRAKAVRLHDGEHSVMVHTVPMPYFNFMNTGSEEYLLAREMDWFGNSVGSMPFPAVTATTAARNKWVLNAEIHAVGGNTMARPAIPSLEDFKSHILVPFSRGVKGFLFWQYKPESLGHEAPAWGLVRPDGGDTPWLGYAVEINRVLQAHTARLLPAFPRPGRIAVLNSSANQTFLWGISGGTELYYQSVWGAFTALYEAQYPVDVLSEHQLKAEGLARYEAVYLPLPYYLDEETAAVLKDFVHEGGTLLSEALLGGICAETNLHAEKLPGYGFEQVFGCQEEQTLTASAFLNAYEEEGARREENRSSVTFTDKKGRTARGYYFRESFRLDGGEVLAVYDNGEAAAVMHRYGRGKAVITGTLPGFMAGKYGCEDSSRYMVSLVKEVAGLTPEAEIWGGRRTDVLYREGRPAAVVLQLNRERVRRVVFADPAMRGRTLRNPFTGRTLTVDDGGKCPIPDEEGLTELYLIED